MSNGDRSRLEEVLSRFGEVYRAENVRGAELPIYENIRVACGTPIGGGDVSYPDKVDVLGMMCPKDAQSYFIKVKGDSMIDAGIYSDDLVVINTTLMGYDEHDVLLCELNGEYTIKRVERREDGVWLIPANPDFADIQVKEGDNFQVWGKVAYVVHKM